MRNIVKRFFANRIRIAKAKRLGFVDDMFTGSDLNVQFAVIRYGF